MRKLRTVVLAGAATLLFAGAAVAATSKLHSMNVDLPDGSVAKIQYSGDVKPRVEIQPAVAGEVALADPMELAIFPDFAQFDRIAAMMDARMQTMMHRAAAMEHEAALAVAPGGFQIVGNVPKGTTVSYSYVSTSNGKTTCTQSVEWRSDGSGAKPRVTRASSGDCGAAGHGEGDKPAPVSAPAPKAAAPAGTNAT